MRNPILMLLLGCTVCNVSAKNIVKLHGRITDPLADSVKIQYAFTSVKYEPIDHAAKLRPDGSFNLEFEVKDEFTSVRFTNGNEQTELFVQPGYDLDLTLDGKNFDSTLHYEGKGKELANFMAKCVLEHATTREFAMRSQRLCGKETREFETELKELQDKQEDLLQKYGNGLPSAFKDYYKEDFHFYGYTTMQMYPRIHEMFKQKSNSIKDIPKENYAIVKDIPEEFNDNYLPIASYRQYMNNYFTTQLSGEHAGEKQVPGDMALRDSSGTRAYRRLPPQSAEFHGANSLFYSMKYTPDEQLEKELADYETRFPRSKNIPVLEEALRLKKTMGPGKPAIDFDIKTPEGKKMKLSDLQGKVVYIDFWSRGCVPCIGEMPDAKKVRTYFKDKPVAFVYVSLDADTKTWEKAIKDFEIDGINTHLANDYESETVKQYGVTGIPSYFLLDKQGKFADVKVVERPSSSEKLIAQIESLLK